MWEPFRNHDIEELGFESTSHLRLRFSLNPTNLKEGSSFLNFGPSFYKKYFYKENSN